MVEWDNWSCYWEKVTGHSFMTKPFRMFCFVNIGRSLWDLIMRTPKRKMINNYGSYCMTAILQSHVNMFTSWFCWLSSVCPLLVMLSLQDCFCMLPGIYHLWAGESLVGGWGRLREQLSAAPPAPTDFEQCVRDMIISVLITEVWMESLSQVWQVLGLSTPSFRYAVLEHGSIRIWWKRLPGDVTYYKGLLMLVVAIASVCCHQTPHSEPEHPKLHPATHCRPWKWMDTTTVLILQPGLLT